MHSNARIITVVLLAHWNSFAFIRWHMAAIRCGRKSRFAEQWVHSGGACSSENLARIRQCYGHRCIANGRAALTRPADDERPNERIFAQHYSTMATGQFVFGCVGIVALLHSTVALHTQQAAGTRRQSIGRTHSYQVRTFHSGKFGHIHANLHSIIATIRATRFRFIEKCVDAVSSHESVRTIEFGRIATITRHASVQRASFVTDKGVHFVERLHAQQHIA